MQAYTIATAVNKSDVAPAVPELTWSLKERLAISFRQCDDERRHKGRARRWRREVDTRKALEHRAAVLSGAATFPGADGARYTWRELVYAPPNGRAPVVNSLRARARTLMDDVTAHGPASGWGIVQPERSGPGADKWTPYYVPKKSEKCWRWWRARRLALARILLALAWWWGKVVPAHRQALRDPTREGQRSSPSLRDSQIMTGYRDHSAEDLDAILTRVQHRFAM